VQDDDKMAYLVVRIKGTVNIPHWANKTLENLNLYKRFHATIVPENPEFLGMLRKVRGIVAWTTADTEIVRELLSKRGKKVGYHPITNDDLPKEYKNIDDLAAAISEGKVTMSKLGDNIKPWFALSPPKGGFKRKTKSQYNQQGVLGEDKELVNLVKRML